MHHPHVLVALVEHGRRVVVAARRARGRRGARRRSAARRPRRGPAATYASTFSRCCAEISGPVSASGSKGPPSRIRRARRTTSSTKRVVQRVLDDQPGAGRADLAGVQEDGREREVDGGLEVGVGEDDVGVLAAEFQRDLLHGRGGRGHDALRPVSRPPVKETRSTAGCSASGAPTSGPAPRTRLATPAGSPASSSARISRIEVERGELAGLEDEGVAGGERGGDLPRRLQQRVVPRA